MPCLIVLSHTLTFQLKPTKVSFWQTNATMNKLSKVGTWPSLVHRTQLTSQELLAERTHALEPADGSDHFEDLLASCSTF